MTGHFSKFKASVNEISSQVIKAALTLHDNVTKSFRKTAQNFH
jgi:dynein heavy chain